MRSVPKNTGFTLVELLIVIVVIAILSTITVVAFNGVQARARDTKRLSDMSVLQKKLEIYKTLNGTYPTPEQMTCGTYGGVTGVYTKNPYDSFIKDALDVPVDTILSPSGLKQREAISYTTCALSGLDQCDLSAPLSKPAGTVSFRSTDIYQYCTLKSNGSGGWDKCYGTPSSNNICDYYAIIYNLEAAKAPRQSSYLGSKSGYIESPLP